MDGWIDGLEGGWMGVAVSDSGGGGGGGCEDVMMFDALRNGRDEMGLCSSTAARRRVDKQS